MAKQLPIIIKSKANWSWCNVNGRIVARGDEILGVEYLYQKLVKPDSTAREIILFIGFRNGEPFLNKNGEA